MIASCFLIAVYIERLGGGEDGGRESSSPNPHRVESWCKLCTMLCFELLAGLVAPKLHKQRERASEKSLSVASVRCWYKHFVSWDLFVNSEVLLHQQAKYFCAQSTGIQLTLQLCRGFVAGELRHALKSFARVYFAVHVMWVPMNASQWVCLAVSVNLHLCMGMPRLLEIQLMSF